VGRDRQAARADVGRRAGLRRSGSLAAGRSRPDARGHQSEVQIDDDDQYERVRKFTEAFLPRFTERIKKYEGRRPIFDHYHIEPALRAGGRPQGPAAQRWLAGDRSGRGADGDRYQHRSFTNTGSGNLEDTVTANNLEACDEVARQLRLRNIGGIIVVDFVDMDKENNRRKVWDAFQKALSRDRARTNVTKISELGLVEMTRKRTRESLVQLLTEPCPTCEGSGVVKSVVTVAYEILREVRRSGTLVDNEKIEIECRAPRRRAIVAPGARLPRSPREAVPEADHRDRPEGLEAGSVPRRRQDVDGHRGAGSSRSRCAADPRAERAARCEQRR
jgi:hypothetical protein